MNKSGFMKDAIVLFIITLVSGICLGGVYEMTKGPIAEAQIKANEAAYKMVFAEAESFAQDEELSAAVTASEDVLAGLDYGNVVVDDALIATDGSGAVVGYVVNSTSKDGYGGNISISVGVKADGTVLGIEFLSISETAGLGMRAADDEFKNQFKDKNAESFSVTKTGASADNEIDALSGATITSSAVTNAVNAAVYFVANCVTQ